MSKQLLSLDNGALVITEDGGDITLTLTKAESLGGGQAAGIIQVSDSGSATFKGLQAAKISEALLNHVLPAAAQTIAQPIENFINSEIAAS